MSTTSLFVDLLVIGMQVAIWTILLVLWIAGVHPTELAWLSGWEAIAVLILIPIYYPAGIFIDNLADTIFDRWADSIKRRHGVRSNAVLRASSRENNEFLNKYFDYVRTRIRISRSSSVNIPLMSVFLLLYLHAVVKADNFLISTVAISGILFTLVALYSWWSISNDVAKKIGRFEDHPGL
jgi:hypothetical protein